MAGEVTFEKALNSAHRSAVHLEMRDVYVPDDPEFAAWRAGRFAPSDQWQWWFDLIGSAVTRGVRIRRAPTPPRTPRRAASPPPQPSSPRTRPPTTDHRHRSS